MRICQVSPTYPRELNTGSGSVPYHLSKYGQGKILFITKKRAGKPLRPEPGVVLKEISYPEFRLPAKLNFLMKVVLGSCKLVGYLIFLIRSVSYMVKFKPQIVHIHTPIPILHGIFGKVFLRAKLALTLYGTDFLRLKSERLLQRCIRRSVDTIFFVSKSMLEDLKQMLPGKHLVYTPIGVDTNKFYDQKRQRKKQLVAVGMLKWQKGYEYLLQAVKGVFSGHPEYKLVIIGHGPLRVNIKEMAKKLMIADRVELLKRLTQEQVATALNESSIFVMSSVTEGFPRALIEAIACGTPVVATDVGSCREIVNGVGFIVKPRKPKEFEKAVNRLIENDVVRAEFSGNCQQVAKSFDWKRTSEIVEREYRKLVS
ncbi:D-inositol-3-phosphate glycosyltransferase [subsurface metagenome]